MESRRYDRSHKNVKRVRPLLEPNQEEGELVGPLACGRPDSGEEPILKFFAKMQGREHRRQIVVWGPGLCSSWKTSFEHQKKWWRLVWRGDVSVRI